MMLQLYKVRRMTQAKNVNVSRAPFLSRVAREESVPTRLDYLLTFRCSSFVSSRKLRSRLPEAATFPESKPPPSIFRSSSVGLSPLVTAVRPLHLQLSPLLKIYVILGLPG